MALHLLWWPRYQVSPVLCPVPQRGLPDLWGWDAYKAPCPSFAKTQGSPLNGPAEGPVPMCMRGSSLQVSQAPTAPETQV